MNPGIKEAFRHDLKTIRLGEFDMGGVLYHANYFHLYEEAREALLRSAGTPYAGLVENGAHLAIVESHQTFRLPIQYGEQLCCQVWIENLKRASCVFHYSIEDSEGNLRHSSWTKHAHVLKEEPGSFQTAAFSKDLVKTLERYSHS